MAETQLGTLSPLSDFMWDELIEKYKQGDSSIRSLAHEYHINVATIRKKFIKCGVDIIVLPPVNKRFNDQQAQEMADDFKNGMSVGKIAKKFGTDRGTVYGYLDRLGVKKIQRQGPRIKKEKVAQDIDELFCGANSEETIQKLLFMVDELIESKTEELRTDIMLLFSEMIRKGQEQGKITILLPENKIGDKESEIIKDMLTASGKLTAGQIKEMVELRKAGVSWKHLAAKFEVSIPTIKYHCRKPENKVVDELMVSPVNLQAEMEERQLIIPETTVTEKEPSIAEVKKEIEAVLEKE